MYLAKVQVVDNAIFITIMTNVAFNVTLVSMFLFYHLNPLTSVGATFSLILETTLLVFGFAMFASTTEALYSSTKFLHLSTSYLNGSELLIKKLKMAAYYEVLQSKKSRLYFSVGSLFVIKNELYLKYFFLYTSYLIYVGKVIRENH